MNKKVLIIISVVLGVVLVILVGVLGYFRGWFGGGNMIDENLVIENLNNGAANQSESSEAGKIKYDFNNPEIDLVFQAIKKLDASACVSVQNSELADNCYNEIAIALNNIEICANIQNAAQKSDCLDIINIPRVLNGKKIEWCVSQIALKNRQEECLQTFIGSNQHLDWCQPLDKENKDLCESIVLLNQAMAKNDKTICANIKVEVYKNQCDTIGMAEETVTPEPVVEIQKTEEPKKSVDTDNDGLTDEEEATLGTDPKNPDSDGDGYKDGEEVKNGYNPLGPGKMK